MNQPNPSVKRPKQRQTAQRQPQNAQLALVLRSLLCEKPQKPPSAFADAMSVALGEVSKTNKANEWNEEKSQYLRNYLPGYYRRPIALSIRSSGIILLTGNVVVVC